LPYEETPEEFNRVLADFLYPQASLKPARAAD
jgi:hypothetical protein